jgi:hypothetical protein
MFIGLMGVEGDGKTLVSPSGKRICKVPFVWMAIIIQRVQHKVAQLTWPKGDL